MLLAKDFEVNRYLINLLTSGDLDRATAATLAFVGLQAFKHDSSFQGTLIRTELSQAAEILGPPSIEGLRELVATQMVTEAEYPHLCEMIMLHLAA